MPSICSTLWTGCPPVSVNDQRRVFVSWRFLNGDQTIAFMLAALMGSLLGFLRYNWRPASIYMGGAMFIGLMLGALSMIGKYTEGHSVSLLTPVLILMPIFDTLFVMYIRFLRGLPVFLSSPDHMAIRLRHLGTLGHAGRAAQLSRRGRPWAESACSSWLCLRILPWG